MKDARPVLCALVAIGAICAIVGANRRAGPPAPATAANAPGPCSDGAEAAARYLFSARGVVRDSDALPHGGGMVLIVRARKWRAQDVETQKAVLATLDCAVSGPSGVLSALHVRYDHDGPDAFTASAEDLVAWRAQGLHVEAPRQ